MARKSKYICDCGHSLAYHNAETNKCHRRVRVPQSLVDEPDHVGHYPFHRTISYEDVDCQCQQFVGNKPKDHDIRTLV